MRLMLDAEIDLTYQQAGSGAVDRSVQDKLRERPTPQDFGVAGRTSSSDPSTWPDDTAALQTYFNACRAGDLAPEIDEPIICRTTNTVTIDVGGDSQPMIGEIGRWFALGKLIIHYTGTRDRPAVILKGASTRAGILRGSLPAVVASGALQWPGTSASDWAHLPGLLSADTGLLVEGIFDAEFQEGFYFGFTKGIEYRNCPNFTASGLWIIDCRYGRVMSTYGLVSAHPAAYCTETSIEGGEIGLSSNAELLGNAYGEVWTTDNNGSYAGHNNHRRRDICFQMGAPAGATYRVPVLVNRCGAQIFYEKCRLETAKGAAAICDGGGTGRAFGCEFEFTYAVGPMFLLQVNGACGNRMKGAGCGEDSVHIDALGSLVTANGGNGGYLSGPLFFVNGSLSTWAHGSPPITDGGNQIGKSDTLFGTAAIAHRRALLLAPGGAYRAMIEIDTSILKNFRFKYAALDEFPGRPCAIALDASGNVLTGNATDGTWGNEPYVKAVALQLGSVLEMSGVTYATGADEGWGKALDFTVREEVKRIWVGVMGATSFAALLSLSITGYFFPNKVGGAYPTIDGPTGVALGNPFDDPGHKPLASANPTSGVLGYYPKGGEMVGSTAIASGVTPGWIPTSAGWLAPPWEGSGTNSTYAPPGRLVTNDTGKVYELITAGAPAASGGPTGTGSEITDGACVWKYIGVLAVFSAAPVMP